MIRTRRLRPIALLAVVVLVPPALGSAASPNLPRDITASTEGRGLAEAVAARWKSNGVAATARDLRVWDLTGSGEEFFVATGMPRALTTQTIVDADGTHHIEFSFEVSSSDSRNPEPLFASTTAAADWSWLNQGCFARISNWAGWLDSCYAMHRLTGESDPRDFYQLQQYGTVGSGLGKIYDGWLMGQKASGSSAMSWIDYNPRQSIGGNCVSVPIQVAALGQIIRDTGILCENWNITKWTEAGKFREQWSCGCVYPFGKGSNSTREINLMQAVSVPNGGTAKWVLTAGFTAS